MASHRPLIPVLPLLVVVLSVPVLAPRREDWAPAPGAAPVFWTAGDGVGGDLPVPRQPWNNQVTDCDPDLHTRINGGCWVELARKPPCTKSYLWNGKCYRPEMKAAKPATSVQP